VTRRLQAGTNLDEHVSSLIYIPGLRDNDDPHLMILCERQEGVSSTGRRLDGHAAVFVGGFVQQIPRKEWIAFLKKQEALRNRATTDRVAPTNTDLVLSEHMTSTNSAPESRVNANIATEKT